MADLFLHNRKDFKSLILTLSDEKGIIPALIEKDYWIMHVLYGLQQSGLQFELKGGTSLSKGYGIIERFSEDIDIHISPPEQFKKETGISVNENPGSFNKSILRNRLAFFDWLALNIKIDGIKEVLRDNEFDDVKLRSAGIRLIYPTLFDPVPGIKDGILLEAGFAQVTPNFPLLISSWMYDRATKAKLKIRNNQASDTLCYHSGYTLVEKLQTISTKYRVDQSEGNKDQAKINFMRQYYDVYHLLKRQDVVNFIDSDEYQKHKLFWFSAADLEVPINKNEAFLLTDEQLRADYKQRYASTSALYYSGQPDFDEMLSFIATFLDKL